MDKNELLKYLICEVDLIMHDKDYRFENEDGTWYSRESCKNLTNEELFEELKTELRQLSKIEDDFADLETKLKEKDELLEDYRELIGDLREELGKIDCEYKTKIFTLERTLIDECKEHREFCRIADKKVKGLEQQLKEERKKVISEIRDTFKENLIDWYEDEDNANKELYLNADEIWKLLDQIERGDNNGNQ
jgi:F0F1-type ATP synthase membrane subunit b/b'